ncbi:TraR/DksA C4-type zinc finger protein [Clostridium sp. CS001]|uniref:TraR/DksA C4-type zinc finger protein n=1 Tax=Clostridium sp. CS001 TaxID=2880648 RepID=UPI001CF512A6|nr:TraR/DksA C4-type zinc finger protein [Clostridium sp. CS001]MCB2288920.1 TraR/DksA C4-type zinc finger protein [Clostridium sp. CS001]
MEKKKLQYFKEKLINEHNRALNLINQMKENEVVNSNIQATGELSFYDNHPSDTASEMFESEKGLALKANEMSIIGKINNALSSIENHTYGKCKNCGKEIIEERLEFIPYAENCVECQKSIDNMKVAEQNNRCVEEDVLGIPFRAGSSDQVGIDGSDTYQTLESFNKSDDTVGYYDDDDDGYVEPIERISNQQYKNQLPD